MAVNFDTQALIAIGDYAEPRRGGTTIAPG